MLKSEFSKGNTPPFVHKILLWMVKPPLKHRRTGAAKDAFSGLLQCFSGPRHDLELSAVENFTQVFIGDSNGVCNIYIYNMYNMYIYIYNILYIILYIYAVYILYILCVYIYVHINYIFI